MITEVVADSQVDANASKRKPDFAIRELRVFSGPNRLSRWPVVSALIDAEGPDLRNAAAAETVWRGALDVIRQMSGDQTLGSNALPPRSLDAVCAAATALLLRSAGWQVRTCGSFPVGSDEFCLFCDYENPDVTAQAIPLALQIVRQVLAGGDRGPEFARIFRNLSVDRGELNSIDRYIYQARERGIPVRRFADEENAIELGTGKYIQRTLGQITGLCAVTAVQSAGDKSLTNKLLFDRGLPVPRSIEAASVKQAVAAAKRIGFPVVLKPLSGNHGRGVCINLKTPEEIEALFPVASKVARSGWVVVETYLEGKDYRILVIDDKIAGVTERVPAAVVGDGVHDIRDLIDLTNAEPNRGKPFENVLNLITIDDMVIDTLWRQGLTLADVPEKGSVIYVRQTANISTGGTSIDRTEEIHPDNALVARMAARTLGLKMAGVDIIMPDISRSVWETGGGIAEVNSGPGFRLHNRPYEGKPRNVVGDVLDMYFPTGSPVRVPVLAVAGGEDGQTVARRIENVLTTMGLSVGLALPDWYVIDGVAAPARGAEHSTGSMVLRNAATEIAVIAVRDSDLDFPGLPFEQLDMAVLMADEDGADEGEQIGEVLVDILESAGRVIVESNDSRVERLMSQLGTAVFLVGSEGESTIERHAGSGGVAVQTRSSDAGVELVVRDGSASRSLGVVVDSQGESRSFALAAAAALAQGIDDETIASGLRLTIEGANQP
jgi:cyanophycin synthetase